MEFIKLLIVCAATGAGMYAFVIAAGWLMSMMDQPKSRKYTGKL
jgi:hypothetical protein